jgi:hypothetical protein
MRGIIVPTPERGNEQNWSFGRRGELFMTFRNWSFGTRGNVPTPERGNEQFL